MSTLKLAFLIVGIILLLIAASGFPTGRVGVGWLGLAFTWASTWPG